MKVLIVDDNANDRKLLRLNLERHGCEAVIEASDGREGYMLAGTEIPDLIISDALMPGVDGFELLRMLKKNDELKGIPFLFHSAVYTGLRDRELALSLGAEAFIAKPIEPEEFWNELSAILKRLEAGGEHPEIAEPMEEEREYLRRYSGVVAAKLEEKVKELEQTLEARKRATEALRASEIRYRRLLESVSSYVYTVTFKDGLPDATVHGPGCEAVSGFTSEEYASDPYLWYRMVHDDDRPLVLDIAQRILGESLPISLEHRIHHRDGAIRWVWNTLVPHRSAGGELLSYDGIVVDITERKRAETALRESEINRLSLQAEITCAAQVQTKLLPPSSPEIPNFEFAARCNSARQVGGDFYDWLEVAPGTIAFTLGDVMGKGLSAAMLMTTARAAVHTATLQNGPAAAIQLAERALRADLESSECFVTLFHAQLNVYSRTLTYVDCGHGYVFLRRADGTVEDLLPRGLPLGVPNRELYQEGVLTFSTGDALVLYSDGLIDARPELALNNRTIGDLLEGAGNAREMMGVLLALPGLEGAPPDDLTVMVVRCVGDLPQTRQRL